MYGRFVQVLSPAAAAVFGPVQAPTTFEETVERLGTAIRLGLLPAGSRLPPERDLADQLSISRSTLRQAITTLTQSGHLTSLRGRTGGTFVADAPPLAESEHVEMDGWRDLLDFRIAVEVGTVLLAAERATDESLARLEDQITIMAEAEDFSVFRRADVAFHLGLAEAARAPRLVAAMTEVQGAMSELIAHIPHPPAVLKRSNRQHERLVECLRKRDATRSMRTIREHLAGTEHIVAGLLP
jgi:GntR family transcriptional regulator, transcriptional repressor for pyruvate dehydrogenase complex